MIKGRIHSIESMGLVDGPGIRTVVFFQGCPLRCAYCHNPDTWNMQGGMEFTPEELLKKILRFKPYFEKSGGGVTFSGGEVLLQPDFLLEILKLCKENNIHTTLDTSGFGLGKYDEILKYTDLVILDIKHVDDTGYKNLTGQEKKGLDEFLKALSKSGTKLWIRHVVVPKVTDSEEHISKLAHIIKQIDNVEKVELLPYHTLGVNKYDKLGLDYLLKDTSPMDKDKLKELESLLTRLLLC
ncbi:MULTISPECIES: pyruvate formate-lyase-activating protein [Clostridium]|uniref:Pyruvate formate-lyase-activating enzyme n=2 Tax=Clostridium TaxID=1485 RepID=A0A151AKF1_9CLOT|nr:MULTISPECIES: pyruvate formate-lyase-activating protein [Clostridium]KYH28149.1 pyruvate formate-lyase 1-activating enzyme [Clostridium colicanis DSM 13634]MBE6043093.1 pyruvate formate lyase-activating protein [Clostridium thermopalmarium]PRR72693.1 Pyruvate formate-lyase 1-activating enzyme [Clostridium thermopalmarium DSM 5974]PVZ20893.1 pyruvate formate lyase activating enzyme [Clostridium thermopalmarium DSM 5974]